MSTCPVLTIAVPTFNRAQRLGGLLESIAEQSALAASGAVEVIISDNCSTDATPAIAQYWTSRCGFEYHRNEVNVGFDRNIARLLARSSGEFVWFMGDDDRVERQFLSALLPQLTSGRADLLIVPDRREDWSLSDSVARRYGIESPVLAPLSKFVSRCGLFGVLGGIGHCVFRRSMLQGMEEIATRGTVFSHVFALTRAFFDRPTLFLASPGFIVPAMTPTESAEYVRRWQAEGLWIAGWWNCFREVMSLFEDGVVSRSIDPQFFRMMFDQHWPFHFHVYQALAKKCFAQHDEISGEEWQRLAVFDSMLGSPAYSEVLRQLHTAAHAATIIRQSALSLVAEPMQLYPPPTEEATAH